MAVDDQWPGLSPWASRAARSRQARPEEAQEPSWGLPRGHFDHAVAPVLPPREAAAVGGRMPRWRLVEVQATFRISTLHDR